MSDDYSNQDPKRNKRRGGGPGGGPDRDYKQSRKPQNKDYQGSYDSRGYDKPSKDQYGSNKGSYYNQYDDYDSRQSKNDNYSYKPKGTHRRQGTEHGAWKKKAAKIQKENVLEAFAKVKSHPELNFWLREYKDLFVKEKQAMVNDEVFQLDPNNGLMPKAPRQGPGNGPNESDSVAESTQSTQSTATTSTTAAKGFEMFDFGKDRYDPIAAMRDRNRKDQDTSKPKKGEVLEETLEDEGNMKSLEGGKGQQGLEEDHEEELRGLEGNGEEGFEGEYSNIDEMFAKKLKNNEIPETFEDAFDDLVTTENKQEKLKQMEDEERPEWEDIDTKDVIEDIKKEDYLAKLTALNQDKKGALGERVPPRFEQTHDFGQSRFLDANKNSGEKQSSNKAFDIDFSKYNFDVDLKLGADDFPIKQEDLFGSAGFGKNPAQQPQGMNYPGMNVGGLNPASMMQQGNMMRPTPQQLQGMQYQQIQQMNQMPHQMHQPMHPMHPMHHQMDYANMQMRGMGPGPGPMGPEDMNRHQFGMHPNQQNYMVNQLPPYKRDPAREAMNANIPRPQPVPNVIFKFFSPSYDEKSWHYIDMQKRVQGPFSGRTMDEWFLNGHLPLTLNVTIGKNNGYKTIKELADIISNPTSAMQSNMRGGPAPQEPPMQQMGGNPQSQAYSGISDLLSNRPDLMQYSPAPTQTASSGKTKTLDEVEKPGPGGYPPQYAQYMKSGGGQGQNYPEYHEMQGQGQAQGQYPGGKPYPKGNGPQGYGMDPSQFDNNPQHKMALGAHPGMNSDPQGRPADIQSGLMMGKSLSANPADQGKQAQGGSPTLPAGGAQAADMTAQLKNMLGLSGLAGLGGLGGLNIGGGIGGLNIGGPSIGETNQSETPKKAEHNTPPKEQDVEKQQERVQAQAQPQVLQAQPERVQQQYQEKQPQRQEKQNYNQYSYQEKQQQPQVQKKTVVKAPRIDTSDFPSLTESYK